MRKAIFALFLLGFLGAHAQSYIPLPMDSVYWGVQGGGSFGSGGVCFCTYQFKYEITGDTLIGLVKYSKVVHSGPANCMCGYIAPNEGCIRQDTAAKKVYFIPKDSLTEYLIYDFTQTTGDTVNSYLANNTICPSDPIVVGPIDSILLNGKFHRRLEVHTASCIMQNTCYFIEGVGSTGGLLDPLERWESGTGLLCMNYKNITVYPDSTAFCDKTLGVMQIKEENFKISPNPSSGSFYVTHSDVKEITVYNSIGERIKTFKPCSDKTKIELEEAGVYFVEARSNEGPLIRKIIIYK